MAELKPPVVLHIATDFPDGLGGDTTKAVKNLIDATAQELQHQVVSVRRVKKPSWKLEDVSPELVRLRFFSPPLGLMSNLMMLFVSLWLWRRLKHRNVQVIHAHKLTTDGSLGYFLSLWTGWPLVISVRGDTDSRFIRYKPFSHWLFKRVIHHARHVFWVSAWACDSISSRLHTMDLKGKYSLLPNIVHIHSRALAAAEPTSEAAPFVFIGKLAEAEKKGLWLVIDALVALRDMGIKATLDVYGGGSEAAIKELEQKVSTLGLDDQVCYLGKVAQQQLGLALPNYTALVMPSRNETFGMVYVEALFSGIPVIGCRCSGIDGHLSDDKKYLAQVERSHPEALVDTMKYMMVERQSLLQQLQADLDNGVLEVFKEPNIAKHYVDTMCAVVR